MENIIVDVRNLELALGISLHEFEGGHTYPLSKLMNALRFPLYRGLALVEADQHTHGFIDVIKILDGEITIFTEAELRGEEK